MGKPTVRLTVRQIEREDVFHDMARLHLSHRPNSPAGTVLKIKADKRLVYRAARGAPANLKDSIWIDLKTRQALGLQANVEADLEISKANCFEEMFWTWNATNPAARIATRVSVVSLILGLVGLGLGVVSLF